MLHRFAYILLFVAPPLEHPNCAAEILASIRAPCGIFGRGSRVPAAALPRRLVRSASVAARYPHGHDVHVEAADIVVGVRDPNAWLPFLDHLLIAGIGERFVEVSDGVGSGVFLFGGGCDDVDVILAALDGPNSGSVSERPLGKDLIAA